MPCLSAYNALKLQTSTVCFAENLPMFQMPISCHFLFIELWSSLAIVILTTITHNFLSLTCPTVPLPSLGDPRDTTETNVTTAKTSCCIIRTPPSWHDSIHVWINDLTKPLILLLWVPKHTAHDGLRMLTSIHVHGHMSWSLTSMQHIQSFYKWCSHWWNA